jgi:hypothetical protein
VPASPCASLFKARSRHEPSVSGDGLRAAAVRPGRPSETKMNQSAVAEVRRKYFRRAWMWFGIPAVPGSAFIFWTSSSGDPTARLCFCVFAAALTVYASYLWACAIWWYSKDFILESMRRAAKRMSSGDAPLP